MMDFFLLFFFSSLRFHLLGCGNQQGCVPNDILIKLFAAHSLSESQSEKGTKNGEQCFVFLLLILFFLFEKTLIVKEYNGG